MKICVIGGVALLAVTWLSCWREQATMSLLLLVAQP